MLHQRTILKTTTFTGLGLHSGREVTVTFKPASEDSGVVFVRTDTPERIYIKVASENVVDTRMATTIGKDGATVSTVEHLLAALFGMGIDNLEIEIDAGEVPVMDGSAAPFIYLIRCAGIKEQRALKRLIRVKRPIRVEEDGKWLSLTPAKEFKVSYQIDFHHRLLRNQKFSFTFSDRAFEEEISRARTFGFLEEVEELRAMGLAKGGSLDNAVVIGNFRVINEEGLRYEDEFVRHKVLDLLGDISLLGGYVIGHLSAYKSGHYLNNMLVKAILSNPSKVEAIEPSPPEVPDQPFNLPAFSVIDGLKA